MRIVHLQQEPPFPAWSGLRADMARRLDGWFALGHAVASVTWGGAAPELEARTPTFLLANSGLAYQARRLLNLVRRPWYVAARMPSPSEYRRLLDWCRAFAPDIVWIEAVHSGVLGRRLARDLGAPFAYRSHNVEWRYLAAQARLAPSLRKRLVLWAGALRLRPLEESLYRDALATLDISADDLAERRSLNDGALHLPVLGDPASRPASAAGEGLGYIGSLDNPNAVAGMAWFLSAVAPLIERGRPGTPIHIAGRRVAPALRRLAQLSPCVRITENEATPAEIYDRAAVLFNPVREGSGVNVKSVDMLASGRRLVTTPLGGRGVCGLGLAVEIEETPHAFAHALMQRLSVADAPDEVAHRHAAVTAMFGVERLDAVMRIVAERLQSGAR